MDAGKIVHVPPDRGTMLKEAFSREGRGIIRRLLGSHFFLRSFWSLYYQSISAWVLQADKMDRHWLGHDWLSAQLQSINSILILPFIPLFSYGIYPLVSRVFPLTPLRKISIGLFLMAATFLITAWIDGQIALGLKPSVGWQAVAYVFLTAAEIMVSITGLEFYYTQSPRKMKSLIMALFLCFVVHGQSYHGGGHQTKRRPRQAVSYACPIQLFLCGIDGGGGGGVYFRGPELQDPNLHPGRLPCDARMRA